jgi:8-amino-7-oxononanoate synthase
VFHVKRKALALGFLDEALDDARRQHLLRERDRGAAVSRVGPSFCSNDYLGLASLVGAAEPGGAGASRLLGGDRDVHRRLEAAAAELVGLPDALVFSSGYAANLGVLAALAGPDDLIVSDALNHASIIDGARLSRARVQVVPHLDVAAVAHALEAPREGRAFVVTESYFSMDADSPDLPALRRVCDLHGAALVVDEAHALGVLGPEGRGLCVAAAVVPDVLVGTFGKAFGAAGAFVAGSPSLVLWCWNRARSFVFSTGLSPMLAEAALRGLATARAEPERRTRVLASAQRLREGMHQAGLRTLGAGPIVPWLVGDARAAWELSEELRRLGLDVRAVRPPTVPPGTARLRITVTAEHTAADLERALGLLSTVARQAPPP